MKKKFTLLFITFILCLSTLTGSKIAFAEQTKIFIGGFPAGFSIMTKGAHVIGTCNVLTEDGLTSPADDANIKIGDVILKINGNEINNAMDIENCVNDKNVHVVELKREKEIILTNIIPAKDINGKYKLGVFIRDNISGIGTITYVKSNGEFASLGHPVIADNGEILDILGGNIYNCNLTGIIKGEKGKAGELRGVFLKDKPIAKISENLLSGVYGKLDNSFNYSQLDQIEIGKAKMGEAKVVTTINGNEKKEFSVSIIKTDDLNQNKNFVIKITDNDLLYLTGGIVQGMSGSPIIQNNKLVGAITHVFLNDPTRGFGISIDNMLNH